MPLRGTPYFFWKRIDIRAVSRSKLGSASERHPYLVWARLAFGLSWLFRVATAAATEPSVTGAKIDESHVTKIYYVDATGADAADDDKHGTQDSPFITVQHAVDVALRDKGADVGTKIIIASGTYRETVTLPNPPDHKPDTDAPLVIEAAEHDQTIIDAADTTGWEAVTWKADGPALVHPWPGGKPVSVTKRTARPAAERETAAPRHTELVFLNGSALRQVDAPAALVPGSFCLVTGTDRKNPSSVTVRVLPPEDAEDGAFSVGTREFGMIVSGRRNVVVRGLCFQHTAYPAGEPYPGGGEGTLGLSVAESANVLIEDVLSQWNNGMGLAVSTSTGVTLRRVRLIHNGGSGLLAVKLKNVLAEDCEFSFNNFRGEWAGVFDPQWTAGLWARGVHGSTWRRQRAVGNSARGLWWAGDCTDLLVEDAVVRDNLFSGLFIEASPGPSVVRGCFVSGNKTPPGSKPETSQPAAVSIEASPDVALENNVVAGNFMPQLGLRNVAERTDVANFETGAKTPLRAERHAYHHNAFWGVDADQVLVDLPVADRAGKEDFGFYYSTLDSDENCFWNPASAEVFCTYDHTTYRRPGMSLAGWRTFLMAHAGAGNGGQNGRQPETGSLWQDPLFMEPGEGDYRLQAQSPLIDWGLPSDEGAVSQ